MLTEYITFRKMITPVVIQVLFWIGVAVSVISGISIMVSGLGVAAASSGMMNGGGGGGVLGVISVFIGLCVIVIGPFIARIWCELIILAFRIYETLVDIRGGSAPATPPPLVGYSQPQPVLP